MDDSMYEYVDWKSEVEAVRSDDLIMNKGESSSSSSSTSWDESTLWYVLTGRALSFSNVHKTKEENKYPRTTSEWRRPPREERIWLYSSLIRFAISSASSHFSQTYSHLKDDFALFSPKYRHQGKFCLAS